MKVIIENFRKFLRESMSIDIDDDSGLGNVFGVIHDNLQNIMNWAQKEGIDEASMKAISALELPVAILKNINVEEEARGQGVGGQLMEEFMSAAADQGAFTVVLIADLGQTQGSGFDLEKWYEDYGFETVGHDGGSNPVMVMVQ